MLSKINIEHVYNNRRWDYLFNVLHHFSFHPVFIERIANYVVKPRFAVIANGIPSSWLHSSVGLRQGCPLSSFLFVSFSDRLSRMLATAVMEGKLKVHQPTQSPKTSYIMFAVDLVLISKATFQHATNLYQMLSSFCAQSRQQTDIQKSHLIFCPVIDRNLRGNVMNLLRLGSIPVPSINWACH